MIRKTEKETDRRAQKYESGTKRDGGAMRDKQTDRQTETETERDREISLSISQTGRQGKHDRQTNRNRETNKTDITVLPFTIALRITLK